MASIATYLTKPPNQIVTVPAGTYDGAAGVFNANAPASGAYNGWLVLVAQGTVPSTGTYPVVVNCRTSTLRFDVQSGSKKLLFVGFQTHGQWNEDGTDIRCWFGDHYFGDLARPVNGNWDQRGYNSPDTITARAGTRIEHHGCTFHDYGDMADVQGLREGLWRGCRCYNPYYGGNATPTWHSDTPDSNVNSTKSYTTTWTFDQCDVDGRFNNGAREGGGVQAQAQNGAIAFTLRDTWLHHGTDAGIDMSGPASCVCTMEGDVRIWGQNGAAVAPGGTVVGSYSTVAPTGPSPYESFVAQNPYGSYETYFTDIFPATVATGTYRDRTGLSWGSYTAWNTIGSPSTGVRTIRKMIRDDRLAVWARIDWGVGEPSPNYSALDTQLLDHVNNGCSHIVIILNGGVGNGGKWPNTSDGNFPTTSDAAAFTASFQAIAQHVRTVVGAGTEIVYECGNEVTTTMRDGSAVTGTGDPLGPFILGKYCYAYSLIYPALKAGDPACRVGPSAPVRNYTRIPSGAPGSDWYSMNLVASSAATRTWCSTDYFIDACDDTPGGILALGTGSIGRAPTFLETGFDMLFIHPYSQEEGPLGQTGAAPRVLSAATVVNTLREIPYIYDALFVISGGARRVEFWGSEMGYANAPYWGSGRSYAVADVVYDPPGTGSTSGVIGDPAGGTMTVPNILWNRGTKWRCTSPHTATASNRPGQPGAPWAAYTAPTTYNKFEAPNIVSEENEVGQHAINQSKVWFGELPTVDGRYLSGPNAGPDQMTGVYFYFQPLDGPGPSNDSNSYNFRYGLLNIGMVEKGNPTSSGPYSRLLAIAGTPLGNTNFGRSRVALGVSVQAVGTKAAVGAATCTVGTYTTALGAKSTTQGVASTALISLGTSVQARGTAAITPTFLPPDPPTIVTALAGDGYADVAWNASPNNHGSPVIRARVTAYTSVGVAIGSRVPTPETALSMRYASLTNGTAVKFTVAWANATAGFGGESAFTNSVTPQGATVVPPDPPASVTAVADPTTGHVTVSWTATPNDHGQPVTGYRVTASNGTSEVSTGLNVTFAGLPVGTYTFTVRTLSGALVSGVSPTSNLVAIAVVATGPGLGRLQIEPLHSGTRTVTTLVGGSRQVVAAHTGSRTVDVVQDGTRTVRLVNG